MLDVRIFFLCAFISHKMIIGAARNPTWDILLRHDLNNQESHLRFYKKLVCIIMSVPFSLGLLLCLKLSWLSAPGKKWLELSLSPGVVAQVCDPSMGELREPVGSSKSAWVAWWGPAYRQTSKKSRWAEALYPNCRGVGISNGRDPWVGMPAWATEALILSPKISVGNSSRTDTANMRFNQCHQETCVQPRRKASGRSSVLLGQSWKHLSDGDKGSMKQILLSCDIYHESRVILCLQACLRPFSVVITKPLEAGSFPPPS